MQVSYEKLMKVLSNVNLMLGIKYKQINLIKSVVDYISAFSGGVIIPDTFFIALVGQSEWTFFQNVAVVKIIVAFGCCCSATCSASLFEVA